jgi:ribosomal protein L3
MSHRAERHAAKEQGNIRYFTGKPCKNGHIAERITINGRCSVCSNENSILSKKKNSARVLAENSKRRAAKIKQMPKWLTAEQQEEIKQIYRDAKTLESVFPWKQHVDHIIPLKGDGVSGLHVPWNLQILSKRQNLAKSNFY